MNNNRKPRIGCGSAILIILAVGWLASFLPKPPDQPQESRSNVLPSPENPTQKPLKTIYITKSGYFAAKTEDSFKKMIEVINHKDKVAFQQMNEAGLIYPIFPRQEVILTGCHGLICSTVTFRYKGKIEEHWANNEAIDKQQVAITDSKSSQ
jgi:hypothetical protein